MPVTANSTSDGDTIWSPRHVAPTCAAASVPRRGKRQIGMAVLDHPTKSGYSIRHVGGYLKKSHSPFNGQTHEVCV